MARLLNIYNQTQQLALDLVLCFVFIALVSTITLFTGIILHTIKALILDIVRGIRYKNLALQDSGIHILRNCAGPNQFPVTGLSSPVITERKSKSSSQKPRKRPAPPGKTPQS